MCKVWMCVLSIAISGIAVTGFAEQCMWCDAEYEWTGSEGRIPVENNTCPTDFTSPNYYEGMMYMRVEVLEKPTDECMKAQICSWGGGEGCSGSGLMKFSSPGEYFMKQSPSDWWTKSSKDWSSVSNTQAILKDCSNKWFSTCGGGHCRGGDVLPHLPVKLHMTIFVVAKGDKLELPPDIGWTCPSDWDCEPIDETAPGLPADLTANPVDGSSIELTWGAATDSESGITNYKIYRDGSLIAEPTGTSYIDEGLAEKTQYSYEVSAVNGALMEGDKAGPVSGTTEADETAPTISNVAAAGDANRVLITFSEQVDKASAEQTDNYSIDQNIDVTGASLQSDGKIVEITVSTLSEDVSYTLNVNGVKDMSSAGNVCNEEKTFTFIIERLVKAFAFGATDYTTESPNGDNPEYVKINQNNDISYSASQGYGYTDTDDIDDSPNDRNEVSCELYDQFIGATNGGDIVFRTTVEKGTYKFVLSSGDAVSEHSQTIKARDGIDGEEVTLVDNVITSGGEYATVTFGSKTTPSCNDVTTRAQPESPSLNVSSGYIDIIQSTADNGGDLNMLEIWLVGAQTETVRHSVSENRSAPNAGIISMRRNSSFDVNVDASYTVRLYTIRGRCVAKWHGTSRRTYLLPSKMAKGSYIMEVDADGLYTRRRFVLQ